MSMYVENPEEPIFKNLLDSLSEFIKVAEKNHHCVRQNPKMTPSDFCPCVMSSSCMWVELVNMTSYPVIMLPYLDKIKVPLSQRGDIQLGLT